MRVLAIETSGKTASCAVLQGGLVLGQKTVYTKLTHSQVILPYIKEILADTETDLDDIDLIAVSAGPGSYTGLRIGISIAKGLAFGGKRCVGVSTLEALAQNCVGAKGIILPIMQARAGVVYFGGYLSDGEKLTQICEDKVAKTEELLEFAKAVSEDIILVGDGAEDAKNGVLADLENARLCPEALRLQQAVSVGFAGLANIDKATDADALTARYLQITKAEKDLKGV